MGAYLFLELGKVHELEMASYNLSNYFIQLSDSHIIRGEYLASKGDTEGALMSFRTAITSGIPILVNGLEQLIGNIRRYDIKMDNSTNYIHMLKKVFANRVKGLLWSAWTPPAFQPGTYLHVSD